MIDMSQTIIPDSTQINADDLISGPRILEITGVKVVKGDQPVSISIKGDDKFYRPCKSMCRVLIVAWGKNGEDYIGRSIKVYLDEKVRWGGSEVGGIRISHMSDIDSEIRIMLTESRGRKSPVTIKPLVVAPKTKLSQAEFDKLSKAIKAAETMPELSKVAKSIKAGNYEGDDLKAALLAKYTSKKDSIANN